MIGEISDLNVDYKTGKTKVTFLIEVDPAQIEEYQDQKLNIEVKKYREKRGEQANKYFHALVNELAKYNRSNNHAIGNEEMKIQMNLEYGTIARDENGEILGAKVPKGTNINQFYKYCKWYKQDIDGCDCYLFFKRTSELDSKEFYQLIKGVEKECQEVGIPTLSDIELNEMMKFYEVN
jgi:hypothetical protein